jgi:hypothetical protein
MPKPMKTRPVSAAQVRAYAGKSDEYASAAANELAEGRCTAATKDHPVLPRLALCRPVLPRGPACRLVPCTWCAPVTAKAPPKRGLAPGDQVLAVGDTGLEPMTSTV